MKSRAPALAASTAPASALATSSAAVHQFISINTSQSAISRLQLVAGPFALAFGVTLFSPAPAHADCGPNSPPAGSTVECTGTTTTRFFSANPNLTITVDPDAEVTVGNTDTAIDLDDNNTVTNFGKLSAGNSSIGIFAEDNNIVINRGTISVGNNSDGISIGDNNIIINSGTITSTGGNNSEGIDVESGNTIINSGRILIPGTGDAIVFTNEDNNLVLLPGSVIVGGLDFSAGNALTVANGLSLIYTFNDQLPATIQANGAPFAVSGDQVAVVDPTNLSTFDEQLVDLTGGISSSLLNRLANARNGGSGVTNSRPMAVGYWDGDDVPGQGQQNWQRRLGAGRTQKGDGPSIDTDHKPQYWVQSFGALRAQKGDGPSIDTDHNLAGLVSGMDAQYSTFTRAGFFLGGSYSEVSAEFDSQDTEADSFFGGAYFSTLSGETTIDMAVTVGYSDYDRERRVANNLVASGIQTAQADYDGFFISPEITMTRPVWPFGRRLENSVTLKYAGLFLDGFTETGVAAPLTVDDREIHVGQARTQLAAPVTHHFENGAVSKLMLKGGAEVRSQFGDRDVSGELLGQNINFNPGGDVTTVGGFVGLSAGHITARGFAFHASFEGLMEDDGSHQLSGTGGVKFQF